MPHFEECKYFLSFSHTGFSDASPQTLTQGLGSSWELGFWGRAKGQEEERKYRKKRISASTGDKFHLYVRQRAPVRTVKTLRHLDVSDLASNKNKFFWYWTSTPTPMLRSIRTCLGVSNGVIILGKLRDNLKTTN